MLAGSALTQQRETDTNRPESELKTSFFMVTGLYSTTFLLILSPKDLLDSFYDAAKTDLQQKRFPALLRSDFPSSPLALKASFHLFSFLNCPRKRSKLHLHQPRSDEGETAADLQRPCPR